ncbi:MAG: polysaccharide export outer membrane protein [Sphingobacteriales bacterium]|jgi:polysaccharide export outer membrane protein
MKQHFSIKQFGLLLFLTAFVVVSISSCGVKKKRIILRDVEKSISSNGETKKQSLEYEHVLRPDDKVLINFFNHPELSTGSIFTLSGVDRNVGGGGARDNGILIDKGGDINLPYVGKLKVAGLTSIQTEQLLMEAYSVYYPEPLINIEIINLRVQVLGEVSRPGTINLGREQNTLVEVLAAAGDLTFDADRTKIKVIRRGNYGEKPEVIIVNLTKLDSYIDGNIYIEANDVVYVEPLGRKFNTTLIRDILPIVSIIASTLSSILLISRL